LSCLCVQAGAGTFLLPSHPMIDLSPKKEVYKSSKLSIVLKLGIFWRHKSGE
jgi:hypothetical protein